MEDSREGAIDRERLFHNERFGHETDPRKYLDKWYWAIRHGAQQQDMLIRRLGRNADVLEYGCSDGGWSIGTLHLQDICKNLTGIDISDIAVAKANDRARAAGAENARFLAMNAEAMTFADASFDLVYGRGIIHHLDLDRCYREIARILKPAGVASFFEPMGHNPALNAFRNRTPDIRTVDEHPLVVSDFERARLYFDRVDVSYFGLFSVGSALVPQQFRSATYAAGRGIDNVVLKLPFVGRMAWYALITLTRKSA